MASRRFPDPAARWVIRRNGDRAKNDPITYYLDAAGQTPAAVYAERGTDTPAPADAFVGSTTTLDAFGGQVDFRGPTDGTSMLFAQVGEDGPIFEVPCKPQDQIVELDARLADLEPGGSGEAATQVGLADVRAQAVDDAVLGRLGAVAAADQQGSLATSQAAMADAVSFIESWANLSAWSSGTFAQISGNRLFANGSGGNSGANHAFAVGAGETMRAVFNVRTIQAGSGGGLIVGVSSDSAGGAFTAGGATTRGLYFQPAGIFPFTDGVTGSLIMNMPNGTVDWTVTLTVDASYISITAVTADGATEVRYKWTRNTVNNITVFNSDSRQLTGHSIGLIGARKATVTVTPRTGIEGVQRTVHWTTIDTNYGIRVALPPSYDSRKPSPLAIMFHGHGSNEVHFADSANGRVVANALLAAGYIVLSCAYTPNVSTWGAQAGLDGYYAAYRYVRDRYAIGGVVIYGNSMGGLESLLTLAERRIPGVVAWVGTNPAANLATAYADPAFASTITTAYAISGGNPYAAATAGHDPALKSGWAFRGLPMLIFAATDDTTIPKATNTDLLSALVDPYADVTVVPTTGGHSFDFTPYTSQIVSFYNAALGR